MKAKKILAALLAMAMVLSVMSIPAFAGGAVAKIGEVEYETLAAAVAAANTGDVVTIIASDDDYTFPTISNNITIAADEGVTAVFNAGGSGSIASVPYGATFKNLTINLGNGKYHGFQHAGEINMDGCILNGLLFSYGAMNFTECTFNTIGAEYSMWCYAGDVEYNSCLFNGEGKYLNIYNEDNSTGPWNITVTDCMFKNSGDANKAALNVKYSCGTKGLKYNVVVDDKTTYEGSFPEASVSDTLIVYSPIIQLDDIKKTTTTTVNITITSAGEQLFPIAVAKIGEVEYYSLEEALEDANSGDTIDLLCAEAEIPAITKSGITIKGELDENDMPKTKITACENLNGVTFDSLEFYTPNNGGVFYFKNLDGVTFKKSRFTGRDGIRYGYVNTEVTVDSCIFDTTVYGIHFDGNNGKLNVKYSRISGFNTFAAGVDVVIDGCTFEKIENNDYSVCQSHGNMEIKNSVVKESWATTVSENQYIGTAKPNAVVKINNTTYENGNILDVIYKQEGICAIDSGVNDKNKYISGTVAGDISNIDVADGYYLNQINDYMYEILKTEELLENNNLTKDEKIEVINNTTYSEESKSAAQKAFEEIQSLPAESKEEITAKTLNQFKTLLGTDTTNYKVVENSVPNKEASGTDAQVLVPADDIAKEFEVKKSETSAGLNDTDFVIQSEGVKAVYYEITVKDNEQNAIHELSAPAVVLLTVEDSSKVKNVIRMHKGVAEKVAFSIVDGTHIGIVSAKFSGFTVVFDQPIAEGKAVLGLVDTETPADIADNEAKFDLWLTGDVDDTVAYFESGEFILTNTGKTDVTFTPAAGLTFIEENGKYLINRTKAAADGNSWLTVDADKHAIKLGTYTVTGVGSGVLDISSIVMNRHSESDNLKVDIPTSFAGSASYNIATSKKKLVIKVTYNNAISNQNTAYQDMKIKISGLDYDETFKLGLGASNNVAFDSTNCVYTLTLADKLVKDMAYTVTVEGAGYRTARYTVTMTDDKTLNFWNNVKDTADVIEEGKEASQTKINFLAGDIVKDNNINIYDLSAVVSYFGESATTENKYAKYDLNRDGKIDSKDVAYVLVSWNK